MFEPLKVAIIGAAPAGCMLARLLSRKGLSPTIFEGEASIDFRSQGGTLDLHTDTGIAAMQQAGLYDDFLKYARFDGESIILTDKHLTRLLSMGGTSQSSSRERPKIDRPKLREILLESLPKDIVRWNHRLRSVDVDLHLHFDHRIEKGFDVVVGADGAWSKVRPLLSFEEPYFAGIIGFSFEITNAELDEPELYKLVSRGSLFTVSDSKSISYQQLGDGSITGSFWITESSPDAQPTLDRAKFSDWNEQLKGPPKDYLDDQFTRRALYMLRVGNTFTHKPGVTLIGDAAHLMTPFAGEGLNLALKDSMELANAFTSANQAISAGAEKIQAKSDHLKRFEYDMFKRSKVTQAMTKKMMNANFFTPGAPWLTIKQYIAGAMSDSVGFRILYTCISTNNKHTSKQYHSIKESSRVLSFISSIQSQISTDSTPLALYPLIFFHHIRLLFLSKALSGQAHLCHRPVMACTGSIQPPS